jgi:hypothetical protein
MALFVRFLVILSRPDVKEIICTFEQAEHPRALLTSEDSLRHGVNKSKLMHILKGHLPQRMQPTVAPSVEHKRVVIIDAMAVVQSIGKPSWVKKGRDLGNHFVDVIDSKSAGSSKVHVVF